MGAFVFIRRERSGCQNDWGFWVGDIQGSRFFWDSTFTMNEEIGCSSRFLHEWIFRRNCNFFSKISAQCIQEYFPLPCRHHQRNCRSGALRGRLYPGYIFSGASNGWCGTGGSGQKTGSGKSSCSTSRNVLHTSICRLSVKCNVV